MISSIQVLVFLCCIYLNSCLIFVKPTDSTVWANQTGPAIFRWEFIIEANDKPTGLRVWCGYYVGAQLTYIIQKFGPTGQVTIVNGLSGRVEVITEINKPGVMSFRLNRVTKDDQRPYGCLALYSDTSDVVQSANTADNVITLQVLDPPQLTQCLQNLPLVKADTSLDISCYAYGNPTPSMQCILYDIYGTPLSRYPSSGPTMQNITTSFLITKFSSHITCTSYGDRTGNAIVNQTLSIQSTPYVLQNFDHLASTYATSIRLRWNKPFGRDTGNVDIQGYKLEWWVSSIYSENQNLTRLDLLIGNQRPNSNYYADGSTIIYEMLGLAPQHLYSYRVYAYNNLGDGIKSDVKQFKPGFQGPSVEESKSGSSKTGLIIGVVIAGIVVLVVIVLVVIFCMRNSKTNKRYPQSYVEDAVDYPASKPLQSGMYAGVDKKQRPASRAGSTSGYPGSMQNGHEMEVKSRASSSYEPSNKSYV